jgi:Tfp pilus assembly protein PilO
MGKLSAKDQRLLLICAVALLLFGLLHFIFFPLLDQRKRLERGIEIRKKGLVEMQAMQEQIQQFSQQSSTIEQRLTQRSEQFSLFAFLEQQSTVAGVKSNILYMRPSDPVGEGELQQIAVEMRLQGVSLAHLVAFIERISSPENVVELERISIVVEGKDRESLDVVMRVITLIQAGQGGR